MIKSKGFTIIELLVVVAIIAVLAAIALISFGGILNSGKDAAIQANVVQAMTGTVVAQENGVATDAVCDNVPVINALAAADKAYDGNTTSNEVTDCADSATAWAMCARLKKVTTGYYCIDSTGVKKISGTIDTACAATWNATVCP